MYFHMECVFHKMRTIYYDLETCIVGKGQKRKQTIPMNRHAGSTNKHACGMQILASGVSH